MEHQRIDIEQQRADEAERSHRETVAEKRTEKALQAARLVAKGGVMSPEAFSAHMKAWGIDDPETVRDAYVSHQEMAKVAAEAKEKELEGKKELISAKAEEQKDLESIKARNRYSMMIQRQEYGLEARKDFEKYKSGILQDRSLAVVDSKTKTKLIGLRETERYIDDVGKMLDDPKFASKMGYFKLGQYAPIFAKDPDRVHVENLLVHEIPRILNLVLRGGQGGASILRTEQGREMVRQLGVMKNMTVPQAREVIKNIKTVVSESRKSDMDGTPLAPWDEYPDLLGSDKDYRPGGGTAKKSGDPLGVR